MFIDFEDARPDTPTLERAISLREGVMISVFVHALVVALLLFAPKIPFVRAALEEARRAQEAQQLALEQAQREAQQQQQPRFVFVQPRLDMPAPAPPPRAELSDQDRVARTVERAPNPTNPFPFSRGNTSERIEAQREPPQRARGSGPGEAPAMAQRQPEPSSEPARGAEGSNGFTFQNGQPSAPRADGEAGRNAAAGAGGGSLGEALKNLQRYVQDQNFHNPEGGGQFGPAIQFDTKGVEFGPWIRRFIAQIRRNWFIPYAAMSLKGNVVLTFNVHKDGRITDLTVARPSSVDAFTNAAFNALQGSNPTQELPPEYPSDKAFFTVTFYYNEQPPSH